MVKLFAALENNEPAIINRQSKILELKQSKVLQEAELLQMRRRCSLENFFDIFKSKEKTPEKTTNSKKDVTVKKSRRKNNELLELIETELDVNAAKFSDVKTNSIIIQNKYLGKCSNVNELLKNCLDIHNLLNGTEKYYDDLIECIKICTSILEVHVKDPSDTKQVELCNKLLSVREKISFGKYIQGLKKETTDKTQSSFDFNVMYQPKSEVYMLGAVEKDLQQKVTVEDVLEAMRHILVKCPDVDKRENESIQTLQLTGQEYAKVCKYAKELIRQYLSLYESYNFNPKTSKLESALSDFEKIYIKNITNKDLDLWYFNFILGDALQGKYTDFIEVTLSNLVVNFTGDISYSKLNTV